MPSPTVAPLKIVKYPDPRLLRAASAVKQFDDSLRDLAEQMIRLMVEHRGVGLAAPQVGQSLRLFVMNPTGQPEDLRVVVNPRLLDLEGEAEGEEGCLSIPEVYAQINRATRLRLVSQDLAGNPVEEQLVDFPARVAQHEFDHLNGTLILDRMGPGALLGLRKRLREMEQKFEQSKP